MKIYAYSAALSHDPAFCINQVRTCFASLQPDLLTSLLDTQFVKYDKHCKVMQLDMQNKQKGYDNLLKLLSSFDLVVIQSFGCRTFGQNVPAEQVFNEGLTFVPKDDAQARQALRAWTVAAHIHTCNELNKPFILYTFDPMIDSNFGIERMHGFAESDDMRLLPFMEARLPYPKDFDLQHKVRRIHLLTYSAKLTTFDYVANARTIMHDEFVQHVLPSFRYNVETSNGWQGNFPIAVNDEASYLNLVANSKFTICPPNYDGRCWSVKRATDALRLGTLPLFIGSVRPDCKLHQAWQPIFDLQTRYDIRVSTLENVANIPNDERNDTIDAVFRLMHQINIRRELSRYVINWQEFKKTYISAI